MARTPTSPIGATIALLIVLIGAPAWLLIRLTTEPISFGTTDLLLGAALVVWVLVAKAVIGRDEALDPTNVSRNSATWQAHQLVEQSILGLGFLTTTADNSSADLRFVAQPRELTAAQLPAERPVLILAQGPTELGDAPGSTSPVLHSDEPSALSVLETQEYTVARGDTFWSIAEVVLGDGRQWDMLQQLNLGREVAPGVVLTTNDELRIGWSVLLPLMDPAAGNEHDHVA